MEGFCSKTKEYGILIGLGVKSWKGLLYLFFVTLFVILVSVSVLRVDVLEGDEDREKNKGGWGEQAC